MRVISTPFRWFAGTRLAHSLRFRLILLVALATLPALGFLFVTASQQRTSALETAGDEADRLVRLASIEQGSLIDETQQFLTLLARLPETRVSASEECNRLMQDLTGTEQSRYVSLGVVERNGTVFCGSAASTDAAAIAEYEAIQQTLQTGLFSIGSFQTIDDRPTLNFAAPIRDDSSGEVVRAVYASLDLGASGPFALTSELPGDDDAVIMILDNNGTLLLRQPELDEEQPGTSLIGTPVVDAVVGRIDEGIDEVDDDDFVYASLLLAGGVETISGRAHIIVALPEEVIVEEANDAFQTNVGRLGVAVLIAVIAAWVGADLFIARDGETRKTLISELYHAYSTGSVNELDELFAPDFVDRSPVPGQPKGVDGVKQVVGAFRAAFPDGTVAPRELLADRDKVVARVTMTGTHLGPYYGLEPTGTRMTADGVETYRFIGGSIVESWSLFGDFVPATQLQDDDGQKEEKKEKRGILRKLFRLR